MEHSRESMRTQVLHERLPFFEGDIFSARMFRHAASGEKPENFGFRKPEFSRKVAGQKFALRGESGTNDSEKCSFVDIRKEISGDVRDRKNRGVD